MILEALATSAFILAAVPALLFRANLRLYQPPPFPEANAPLPCISILIPARNEECSIQGAVESALSSIGVNLEVIVLDDHSEDATATIVQRLADRDSRVHLVKGPPLPDGWCGKQHACWALAQQASHELLLFLDADVRLAPDGALRMVMFLEKSGADLVSGIPWQETGSLPEQLVIPLIHFVLLGFLPMMWMRSSRSPAYGAGCGQLFLARRSSYEKAGGHAAIRATLHDGIHLPRSFRSVGLRTDLCDATDVARCRMYHGGRELWHGLAKNATEGLGAPKVLVPMTLFLLIGQILPFVLLSAAPWLPLNVTWLALAAAITSYLPRLVAMVRFRQSIVGAFLHPIGVLILLAIQWYAMTSLLIGKPRGWRGRTYTPHVASGQSTP
jgi:hypothetical protein